MLIPELKRLQDLLTSFLGTPKNEITENNYQLQYPCPRCIEERGSEEAEKYNLEITLGKCLLSQGGLFHCWSCCSTDDEMRGGVYKLIRKYGNSEILRDYKSIIATIKDSAYYKMPEFEELFSNDNTKPSVVLPSTFTKVNLATCKNSRVVHYLESRKISQDIIDRYNIGYTTNNETKPSFRNRIIIPSYDEAGELNFWTGRDFTGAPKRPKYFNAPDVDKNQIIYQEKLISWDADILLVEGGLDALFYPNAIALLGKSLNNKTELYRTLQEKANANVIICLDADTDIYETKRIFKVLNTGRLRGKIKYIRMTNPKDLADVYALGGPKAVAELLKKEETFSEIDLLLTH